MTYPSAPVDHDTASLLGQALPRMAADDVNLSAAGVSELAKDMRAFGAQVRVIASEPVAWREES